MSNALVKIQGTVVNTIVWTPREGMRGKPVLKIDILQINDLGSHVETIKDDDLNAQYYAGQQVALDCIVTPWAFDKKNGASLKVYKGRTQEIKVEIQEDIPLGKESVKSK